MLESANIGDLGVVGAVMWGATACVSLYVLVNVRSMRFLFGTASILLIALAAFLQAGFIDVPGGRLSQLDGSQLLLTLSSIPMLLAVLLCAHYRQERSVQETALASSISGVVIAGLDGRIQYANTSFAKLLGKSDPREIVGHVALDYLDDPEEARRIVDIILQKGSWRGEIATHHPDGTPREVDLHASLTRDANGAPTAIIGSVADVSHSREKERQLRFSNTLLTSLVESAPILLWTANADGEIGLLCGRGLDSIKQLAEEDGDAYRPAPGTSLYDLFRGVPEMRRYVDRVLAGRQARFEWQCGESVFFEVRLSPRYAPAGKVTGIVGVALDVSTRVAAEHALERNLKRQIEIEQRLDRAQRLEAVGRLTGGIAHDFNNLLTTILGNLDMVAERAADDPELRRYAESASHAAGRGAELTQRLLAFSRHQALTPQSVEVNGLLNRVTDMLGRTLPATITIARDFDRSPVLASVDPGQLENAVLNLALNARDAMPEGGTLTLTTRKRARRAGGADMIAITLADTGAGMSPEIAEKAFEPFFTTKKGEAGGAIGSGLGLSMVYGFAAQSDGRVEIDSAPGKGTAVTLFLPRTAASRMQVNGEIRDLRDIQEGSDRIMVVEDDADVRQFIVNALKRLGYSVVSAENGPEAMRVASGADTIDLLISDVVLPGGMTGPDVADRFLEIFPKGKVLFTSGYIGDDLVMRARLENDVELLSKPYTLQALAAKVRTVLDPTLH